jgi:hypothetical protein
VLGAQIRSANNTSEGICRYRAKTLNVDVCWKQMSYRLVTHIIPESDPTRFSRTSCGTETSPR